MKRDGISFYWVVVRHKIECTPGSWSISNTIYDIPQVACCFGLVCTSIGGALQVERNIIDHCVKLRCLEAIAITNNNLTEKNEHVIFVQLLFWFSVSLAFHISRNQFIIDHEFFCVSNVSIIAFYLSIRIDDIVRMVWRTVFCSWNCSMVVRNYSF